MDQKLRVLLGKSHLPAAASQLKWLSPFLKDVEVVHKAEVQPLALLTTRSGCFPALCRDDWPPLGSLGAKRSGRYPPSHASSRPDSCIKVLNLVARWNHLET